MFEIVLILLAAMLGGALGSFLNVVIWRVPAGMSLIYPDSHCPRCQHPIRFYDNLPIFGWLLLRGRCRDCHLPISVRYPLVETLCCVMAGMFFFAILQGWTGPLSSLLYWNEMWQWRNIPVTLSWTPSESLPVSEELLYWSALVATGWFLPFYFLLGVGLIQYDGKKVPRSLLITGLFLLAAEIAVGFFLWREMTHAGMLPAPDGLFSPLIRIVQGTAIALVLALVTAFFLHRHERMAWTLSLLLLAIVGGVSFEWSLSNVLILAIVGVAPAVNQMTQRVFKHSCPILILFFLALCGEALLVMVSI